MFNENELYKQMRELGYLPYGMNYSTRRSEDHVYDLSYKKDDQRYIVSIYNYDNNESVLERIKSNTMNIVKSS